MKITILTNEYPPNVYGGAGVHVEYLSQELAALEDGGHDVEVLCFGEQQSVDENLRVQGVAPDFELPRQDDRHAKFMDAMARNLLMAGAVQEADIVHAHTWYSHLAGCLVKQLAGGKLVLTTHSLEPHRPWKVEQLGAAYQATSWVERMAYENADGVVAVSSAMKDDVESLYDVDRSRVRVIHNGIDIDQYRPRPDESVLEANGIDPSTPYVLFVGRVTRQKGILHLVEAIRDMEPGVQVVLCAGAPDTEAIGDEMEARVQAVRAETDRRIVWITEVLPRSSIITLYTHAEVFVCPSVYEPFGIINLEAMACETPVVASAVGGIPEIVVSGETGLLVEVDIKEENTVAPVDPEGFANGLAEGVNTLMRDPEQRRAMGVAARERVETHFRWEAIAEQTLDFYRSLIS